LNPDVGGYTKTLNHLKKLRTTQQHAENQNISGGRLHLARQGRDIIRRPGSYATDTKGHLYFTSWRFQPLFFVWSTIALCWFTGRLDLLTTKEVIWRENILIPVTTCTKLFTTELK